MALGRLRERVFGVDAAIVGVAVLSVVLGIRVGPPLFAGILLIPFLVLWRIRLKGAYARERSREELAGAWSSAKTRVRNFESLERFYKLASYERFGPAVPLDDQTWKDLNMDALYAQIDRTHSVPGGNLLYELLRKPLLSKAVLAEREEMVRALERSAELRESVQLILRELGRSTGQGAAEALWKGMPAGTGLGVLYNVLAMGALASLPAAWLWGSMVLAWVIIPLYLINMSLHYTMRNRIGRDADTIKYLCRLVGAGSELGALPQAEMASTREFLREPLERTRAVGARSNLYLGEVEGGADPVKMLIEYVSIYFLEEVRRYESLLKRIRDHSVSLRAIYQKVGELDALQAIASFRAGLGTYATPQLEEGAGVLLETRDVRHPLIENAVANSIAITTRGIAITGSNMSGKTTFLRTVAVNAILAQTIYACTAGAYTGRFLRVVSSINEGDDLLGGKSYFLVEAERLLHMLRCAEGEVTSLCLIDEPLAGTKSVDRHAALQEILGYMLRRNVVILLSTHDVDLVAEMGEAWRSYHFGDEVHASGVVSDFRLRDGLSYESNAIKVLDHLGYPKEIVERSLARLAARSGK